MPSDYSFTNAVRWDTFFSGRNLVPAQTRRFVEYGSSAAQHMIAPSRTEPIEQARADVGVNQGQAQNLPSRPADTWIARIRDALHKTPGVESVHFAKDGDNIDIWTLIPSRDLGLVRRVVEAQDEIVRLFTASGIPPFFFDFHVVYRGGRQSSELVPLRSIELPLS